MANILYSGTDFPQQSIPVEESLYETLYRLQEAHWGLRDCTDSELTSAIDWLRLRLVQPSSQLRWSPTDYDRERTGGYRLPSGQYVRVTYLKLPSGEAAINYSLTFAHLFLSATPGDDPDHRRISDNLLNVYPGPKRRPELLSAGTFCCPPCTTQYQLALSKASPGLYREQEPSFIEHLRASRSDRRRWYRYPFYYTILALHEIHSEATQEELQAVAQGLRPSLLRRYQGSDRQSRFRRLAIEIALGYR